MRFKEKKTELAVVAMLTVAGMAFLAYLGNWQRHRLVWKTELIKTIENRVNAPAISSAKMQDLLEKHGASYEDLEYIKVKLSGRFLNKFEYNLFTITDGKAGWHIYTPFELSSGKLLMVNRGFVPEVFKSPEKRPEGFINGLTEITGLIRVPPVKKPGYFVPENEPEKNVYHWRSLADMTRAGPPEKIANYLPVMLDMRATGTPKSWPVAGTTVTQPKNSHFGYMLTWYGLSLAMLLVSGFYMHQVLKDENPPKEY